jgi:hypothetical protein
LGEASITTKNMAKNEETDQRPSEIVLIRFYQLLVLVDLVWLLPSLATPRPQ